MELFSWLFSLPILIISRGCSDAWGYALLQAVGGQRGQKGRPGHINCPTWMEGNYPIICNCTQLQFIMLRSTMSEDILRLQSGQDTFPSNDLSPWNVMNKHNLPTVITLFCFQAWLTLMDFKGCYYGGSNNRIGACCNALIGLRWIFRNLLLHKTAPHGQHNYSWMWILIILHDS